jgi:hypothetical protein
MMTIDSYFFKIPLVIKSFLNNSQGSLNLIDLYANPEILDYFTLKLSIMYSPYDVALKVWI